MTMRCRIAMLGLPLTVAGLLLGCSPAKTPFVQVQLCLRDQRGLDVFREEMRAIARAEHMDFRDLSSQTAADFKVMGNAVDHANPVIVIAVDRKDGLGLAAVDLDTSDYQVGLGFTEGKDVGQARDFARRVIDRLRQRWTLLRVPSGRGAQPLSHCA